MAGKQNSILNYFARTPKTSTSTTPTNSPQNTRPNKTPDDSHVLKESSSRTPSSAVIKNKFAGTPKSSRDTDSTKRKSRLPATLEKNGTPKRLKVDDSPTGKNDVGADYINGDLVWARLEGYPWWPAMIRGEQKNSSCYNKELLEYHVQFFDKPPSRAWIRKSDLKKYGGIGDGRVPPAKNDPNWLESCKYADGALNSSREVRLERYWQNFPEVESDDEEENISVEEKSPETTPSRKKEKDSKRRRILVVESDESDEDGKKNGSHSAKINGKRKPIADKQKDDSDYEFAGSASSSESVVSDGPEVESEEGPELDSEEDTEKRSRKTPAKPKKLGGTSRLKSTPKRASVVASAVTPKTPNARKDNENGESGGGGTYFHLTLEFLKRENIMDIARRRPDHPDYDPKTLYIPLEFKERCTPAVRQWWEMKSRHFDTVLFFKLGKFYELYNMDAVVGVQELGIDMMRGEIAHCGFPEIAFTKFANMLVNKGYKVARVEQTETPDMMTERCKNMSRPTKFDRVVKRELCQVVSKGVRVATFLDMGGESHLNYDSAYLYGIIERPREKGRSDVGVCFVDTTVGKFFVSQFVDDRHFSRLRTVMSHFSPAEILHEKGKIHVGIQCILEVLTSVRKNALVPDKEFWNESKTLKVFSEEKYFWDTNVDQNVYPKALQELISKNDHLSLTAEPGFELALRSLGAVVWYLKQSLVEFDLLSMKDFELYVPVDEPAAEIKIRSAEVFRPKYMVLDSITLRNLEVNTGIGSLISKMDYCSTHFGKRMLRNWICLPLLHPDDINARLDAIEDLRNVSDEFSTLITLLKSLPDLPRLIAKVHTLGSEHRGKEHPDSRAFFFEEVKYSKKKVTDMMNVFKAFGTCVQIINRLKSSDFTFSSTLLTSLLASFPDLDKILKYFKEAFDHEEAKKEGKIIPAPGVDLQYDSLLKWQDDFNYETETYLKSVSKRVQAKVTWFGSDKKRFQMEMPANVQAPSSFEMSSSRKGFKRYVTKETKDFLSRLQKIESSRAAILKDLMRRVFEKVDSHRKTWAQAIAVICELDVLISLAKYSLSQDDMCRPEVKISDDPYIVVENGRHPCVPFETYIPNSCQMGPSDAVSGKLVLLTGPNMGGKSTLMRQMGILSILAQIGSYVPATKCELSPVDRIFTRVGARDNIMEGESTFFIEMSETSAILKHATKHSLVLVDELGRGTATHDGTAIAYAVARALVGTGCRCLFSTHYHKLVDSLSHLEGVQLGHMACMVENENEEDPTQETVTFLYKLVPGACPKSYGFNAARLAGLPTDIIRAAFKKAKEIEQQQQKLELFRQIVSMQKLTLQEARSLQV